MKFIVAIIRHEKLDAVQKALNDKEVFLMTVTDVRGCGRQRGYREQFRGETVEIRLVPKLKLEIAVNDEFLEPALSAISQAAHTGSIGDGKIFVLPLEECLRIRTGERNNDAIGP